VVFLDEIRGTDALHLATAENAGAALAIRPVAIAFRPSPT